MQTIMEYTPYSIKGGFGTYRLRDDTYEACMYALKDAKYVHIDNAPLYKNQSDVGKAIKDSGIHRKKIYFTTKISRNQLKNKEIKESFLNTLAETGLDYIDELMLHEPINYIDNWKQLCELYETIGKNKIRYIGVSNFNESQLEDIIQLYNNKECSLKPMFNQIEVNPFLQRIELIDKCRQYGIPIVAHTPLAKGEKLNDKTLSEIAEIYKVSTAQLMLQWSKQKGYRIIPRSKDKDHIDENNEIINKGFIISESHMNIIRNSDCGYATHPKYIK